MNKVISFLLLVFFSSGLFAQAAFEGVVDMNTINNELQEKADITWYIKNGNHRLEYTGTKAGESYNYVFLIKSGGNLLQMLSEADGKKVYYDIPRTAITSNIKADYGAEIEKSEESKLIGGFAATKYKVISADKISTVWITEKSPLSISDMPSLLLNNSVLKYLQVSGINGIPVEINSTNTGGALVYSQKINAIKKQQVSDELFEIPADYKSIKESMQAESVDQNSADQLQQGK